MLISIVTLAAQLSIVPMLLSLSRKSAPTSFKWWPLFLAGSIFPLGCALPVLPIGCSSCSWLLFGFYLAAPRCFFSAPGCSWLLLLLAISAFSSSLVASPGILWLFFSWLFLVAPGWLLAARGWFYLSARLCSSGSPNRFPSCYPASTWLFPAAPGCFFSAPGCSWLLLAISGFSWSLVASPGILWLFCSWLFLVAPGWFLAAPGLSWLFLSAPGVSPCCSWLVLSFRPVVFSGWPPCCSWLVLSFRPLVVSGSPNSLPVCFPVFTWLFLAAPGCFFFAPCGYWLFLASPGLCWLL
jgi:hypothetical protein